jgi:hypothetical protein
VYSTLRFRKQEKLRHIFFFSLNQAPRNRIESGQKRKEKMKKEMPILKGKYAIPGLGGTWNSKWLIRVYKHQQDYKQRITLPVLSIGYKKPFTAYNMCTTGTKGEIWWSVISLRCGNYGYNRGKIKTNSKLPQ